MNSSTQLAWTLVICLSATTSTTRTLAAFEKDEGSIAGGACPADVDNSGTVNVSDLLSVINGWGSCAAPCPPHCAADTDDNCAVNVIDLLAVINAWGPCPCTPDAFEPNDDCGSARLLNAVGSDQTQTYTSMNLAGTSDVDIYRLPCNETDNSCGCGSSSFDEDFILEVTLTVPASAAGPYEFCLNVNSCGWPAGYCINVAPGATVTRSINLDGACGPGQTDSYTGYVRISATMPSATACAPYTLSYFFDAGHCQ